MVRGLKVSVDLNLEAVSCPGTILQTSGYVFVELQIFRNILRSEFQPPIFPLLLHKKLSCTHVFPHIIDPGRLADELNKQVVSIRLVQETGLGDQILAQYVTNARDFLFPTPLLSEAYPGVERQILLSRTSCYTGIIEPKVEFSSKTTIKEVNARPKHKKTELSVLRAVSPSPTRSRGHFEMSVSDDRLTRKTAQNLAKAKNVLEKEEQFKRTGRSKSKRRGPEEPRYMDSTVSFRAKSPRRKTKSKNKKPLPFLAGSADNNLARYQGIEPESTDIVIRETLPPTLEDEGNTYEKIRHRITRLLKSPRAQEVNKNGELEAALHRLDKKIERERNPTVRLSDEASWSRDAHKYRGSTYRSTFDATMRELNDDLVQSYQ